MASGTSRWRQLSVLPGGCKVHVFLVYHCHCSAQPIFGCIRSLCHYRGGRYMPAEAASRSSLVMVLKEEDARAVRRTRILNMFLYLASIAIYMYKETDRDTR